MKRMSDLQRMAAARERLLAIDFEARLPDAPTMIERAEIVEASEGRPKHLEVWGWVAPQRRFVIKLPLLNAWNRRSLFVGSGGPGGIIWDEATPRGLELGFATATCDTGHTATGAGSLWSWGNEDGFTDWAWRGVHAVATAVHEIIAEVYEQPISRRYYVGVSTGGRHAMIEAQRFPGDFDGILANDSGHNYIYATYTWPWLAQRLYDAEGTPIIELADMPVIVEEVHRQAEEAGAVEHGEIVRPWDVRVDVDRIPLSEEKRAALRALYFGPEEQPAERGFRGVLPGSEARGDWEFLFAGSRHLFLMARGLVRFQIYNDPLGPTAALSDWRPEHWPASFTDSHEQCGAVSPDLDEFRARGGKLLITQSLGDTWVDPRHARWYWEDLVERYGDEAGEHARLFLIPGRGHGSSFHHYGHTADTLDLLVRWVEEELPPEQITVGKHTVAAVPATLAGAAW